MYTGVLLIPKNTPPAHELCPIIGGGVPREDVSCVWVMVVVVVFSLIIYFARTPGEVGSIYLLAERRGEVRDDVAASGVGEMASKVLNGSDTGHDGLSTKAEHGEHGKTTVLDLTSLHLSQVSLVLSEAEGVEEGTTRVGRVARATEALLQTKEELLSHGTRVLEVTPTTELSELHQDNVDPENSVGVTPVAVVRASGRDDTGLEPDETSLGRDGTGVAEDLGREAPSGTKHSPAAVDDLSVREPLGGDVTTSTLGVRETERVETVVTGEGAVEVGQGSVRDEAGVGLGTLGDLQNNHHPRPQEGKDSRYT